MTLGEHPDGRADGSEAKRAWPGGCGRERVAGERDERIGENREEENRKGSREDPDPRRGRTLFNKNRGIPHA